jgi:hypothetical protein
MTPLKNLTPEEEQILALYADPRKSDLSRAIRLSIQYAIGAGIFLVLAIQKNQPWYAAVTYLVFLAYMGVRIVGAKKLSGIMPSILQKYDARIAELESKLSQS